ncbi:MAG: RagB/SusD family nutrient uptake outer membrane protein [Gemmatimonadetes bacterium]|nr:RagB/SusD family nutrient uptake outer membrane protein [Gemmatimonadota bacterium]
MTSITNIKRLFAASLAAVAVSSCDTEVVNPGPIDSSFLDDPASQLAIANGAGRALADALNWISYTSAAIAREVHPSGSTGSFGISPNQQDGRLEEDEVGAHWSFSHRARFLATNGLERIDGLDPADQDQEQLAQLYLWAGFTHRLLGESMCQAVIDGGAQQSHRVHLNDALAAFNQAASFGDSEVQNAAIAGRASVHVQLGDWDSAVADATRIQPGMSFVMPYFSIGDDAQANRIHRASRAQPYKAHTTRFTWVEGYGQEPTGSPYGDPRIPYVVTGTYGDAATGCCGSVDFNPQQKHGDDDSPIELASYEEMQLIIAEDLILHRDDIQGGMAIINSLRTAAGMNAESAGTLTEAMTFLKREHAIEMWLEGRRLAALRRWNATQTPGDLHPLEQVGDGNNTTGSHLETRDFCFPISEAEWDTNPNLTR